MFAGCRQLVNDYDPDNIIYYDPDHTDYTYGHPVYTDTSGKLHRGYFFGTLSPETGITDNPQVPSTDPVLDNPVADEPSVSDPSADNPQQGILPQDALFAILLSPFKAIFSF